MAGFVVMKIHQRKNGYWYVRKAVPQDVREIIGKTEFIESLKTKDKDEAAARAPAAITEIDKKIAEARLKLAPKPKDSLTLTPKDAHVLADLCLAHATQQIDEAGDIKQVTKRSLARYFEHGSDERTAGEYVSDFLESQGVSVSPNSKAFKQLAATVAQHLDKLEEVAFVSRLEGDWRSQPEVQFDRDDLTASGQAFLDNSITITALLAEYKAEEFAYSSESKKATLTKRFRDIEQVSRWFIEHVGGDIPVQRVTKQQVSQFITKLRQRPSSKKPAIKALPLEQQITWAKENGADTVALKTIQKDVKLFQSVFSFAVHRHYIESNPFAGALKRLDRVVSKAPTKMTGYSDDDLEKAFGSDLFRYRYKPHRPKDVPYGLSVFWIPLIAYYTGARLNEIAQLHLDDIRKDEGIWCIDISPNDSDKRTKNGKARLVPIHQHLIDLGFLEYINEGRQQHADNPTATSHRVFPMLKPNTDGDLAAEISKVIGRRLKAAGIASGTQPMHGFRHYIKTTARRLGVAEDVHDAITGHSGTSVGRGYGGLPTETADKVIQQIDRANLPVSHYSELE